MALRPQFSLEINLGHIVQTVLFVGGIIWAMNEHSTAQDQEIALQAYRLDVLRQNYIEMKTEDESFRSEARGNIEKALQALDDVKADVKVLNVQKQDRR